MSPQPQTTGIDMSPYIAAAVECSRAQDQDGIKVVLKKVMAAQTLIAIDPAFQGSGQKIFIAAFFESVLQGIASQHTTDEEKKDAKDLFIKNFKSIVPKADIKQMFLSNIKILLETADGFKAGLKDSAKPDTTISALNIKNANALELKGDQTLQEWYSEQQAIKNNNVMSKLYSFVSKAWKGSGNQRITEQQAQDIARFIINMDLAKEIENSLITGCDKNITDNESKLEKKGVQTNILGAVADEKDAKLIVADALNVIIVAHQIGEGLGVSIKELENIDKTKQNQISHN
jgi:hypothetical protein